MKRYYLLVIFILSLICLPSSALASGIAITGFGPSKLDTTNKTVEFKATMLWQNSWRNDTSYDALWCFLKVQGDDGTERTLKMAHSGINPPGFGPALDAEMVLDFDVIVPEDKVGFFVIPGSSGVIDDGTSNVTNLAFLWDYSSDAIAYEKIEAVSENLVFKLYAIEMTYVPEGAFTFGGGYGSGTQRPAQAYFKSYRSSATINTLSYAGGCQVTNGDSFVIGDPLAEITTLSYCTSNTNPSTQDYYTLGASYPKGYKAFYLMKYEISQGQYRDFLNSIGSVGTVHCGAGATTGAYCYSALTTTAVSRQYLKHSSAGTWGCDADSDGILNESNDGEWVAMNNLAWRDLAAYLDWAGLRPTTEMEFEKAARGTHVFPVTSYTDFAWGNSTSMLPFTSVLSSGTANEKGNQGNAVFSKSYPLRSGSFLGGSREESGAGMYGNYDLSGNVAEMVVTAKNPSAFFSGTNFAGSHGDGVLSSGNATNTDWPGYGPKTGEVTSASSDRTGFRGGSYLENYNYLCVSDRSQIYSSTSLRLSTHGGRGARSAPVFANTGKF
ncbi:MAG: SUMF1/EgtB/PvdO family nonheme iron enzyme [Candidatus Aceula lacicola]|nr:SUMF1/EgtB/PvdO family nonheme iron enzyme [Candidatus Aceula lacicola]